MKVFSPSLCPAYTGGSEVKPPMPSTASAWNSRMIFLHCRIEPHNFHKNSSIRGENVGGLATAGTVLKFRCVYFAEAWESTFFSEMSSITSWPRARSASPTAIPGNRWPPVPPQAMRIFRDLGTGKRVSDQETAEKGVPPTLRRKLRKS